MRSQHVDKFNHDSEATGYDEDVQNEANPIRAGYQDLLSWVAACSNRQSAKRVLDLGVGTGNLSVLLKGQDSLTCVDTSSEMMSIASEKLDAHGTVVFQQADLLEFFDQDVEAFDSIVSTYAIHHLTEAEKHILLEKLYDSLKPEGVVALGDLMFENQDAESEIFRDYRNQGNEELVEDIQDEFFWYLEPAVKFMEQLGFTVETQRFSDLSWGIFGQRS